MKFPGGPIPSTLVEGPRSVRLAEGQMVAVRTTSVPLGLKLHTARKTVQVKPQVLAVMSWDDNTRILERTIFGMLRVSPNVKFETIAYGKLER